MTDEPTLVQALLELVRGGCLGGEHEEQLRGSRSLSWSFDAVLGSDQPLFSVRLPIQTPNAMLKQ